MFVIRGKAYIKSENILKNITATTGKWRVRILHIQEELYICCMTEQLVDENDQDHKILDRALKNLIQSDDEKLLQTFHINICQQCFFTSSYEPGDKLYNWNQDPHAEIVILNGGVRMFFNKENNTVVGYSLGDGQFTDLIIIY